MKSMVMLIVALSLGTIVAPPPAVAAGCLKGAALGGLAGHMAGHGVAGAAAGCAIGHHEASKKAKQNATQTQPSDNSGQLSNTGKGMETSR